MASGCTSVDNAHSFDTVLRGAGREERRASETDGGGITGTQ